MVKADNGPGYGPGAGYAYGYCNGYGPGNGAVTDTDHSETFGKFQAETADIRRDMVVKQSTLNALMRQDNPDENKVAALTGELYDLRDKLDAKAEEAGVERYAYARGPGMMWNGGRGRGRHMMDW